MLCMEGVSMLCNGRFLCYVWKVFLCYVMEGFYVMYGRCSMLCNGRFLCYVWKFIRDTIMNMIG